MIRKARVPTLSANVDEVTVTDWFVREGDRVSRGQPIAELTTDKAAFELEAPAAGTVRRILAARKSVLPVGYVLALIGGRDDPLPEVETENARLLAQCRPDASVPGRARKTPERRKRRRVRATPAARRLARERGVDLSTVTPAADGGPVTEAMVRRHGKGPRE